MSAALTGSGVHAGAPGNEGSGPGHWGGHRGADFAFAPTPAGRGGQTDTPARRCRLSALSPWRRPAGREVAVTRFRSVGMLIGPRDRHRGSVCAQQLGARRTEARRERDRTPWIVPLLRGNAPAVGSP